ncbi:hypothetical protein HRbin39_01238 [bacterium HR39]|nr:hypothetical protein HRbin39_01238 [bacterium HR39]
MPVLPILVLPFLIVPLAEIALLIEVGGRIGTLPTIAACLGTAVLGGVLVRSQRRAVIAALRRALDEGRIPAREAFDGACILVAGALLMTPGFLTDAAGFALLVPPLRAALYRALVRHLERRVLDHLQTGGGPRGRAMDVEPVADEPGPPRPDRRIPR